MACRMGPRGRDVRVDKRQRQEQKVGSRDILQTFLEFSWERQGQVNYLRSTILDNFGWL